MRNYLLILEDSLRKKTEVLDRIGEVCQMQANVLKEETFDMETFDRYVDEKDIYLQEMEKLDEGFESLYDKLKEELIGNKEKYAAEIKRLQKLIADITEQSISIQAQESRNKDMVAAYFKRERQNLKKGNRSNKAAYDYYQNMSKSKEAESFFLDEKK